MIGPAEGISPTANKATGAIEEGVHHVEALCDPTL
jgi:hypothetical protein